MKTKLEGLKLVALSNAEKNSTIGGRLTSGNGRDGRLTSGNGRDGRITSGNGRDGRI